MLHLDLSLLSDGFSFHSFGTPSCFEMCEVRISCRCFEFLWFFFFLRMFFTWGNWMPEYLQAFMSILKSIWLKVHLQGRKKALQGLYFICLNYCPAVKGDSKLMCLKKKIAIAFLSHSHSPLRFFHFLPMAFFRSECVFLTSGNKGCFVLLLRFVCVTYFRTLSRKCYYYLHRVSRTFILSESLTWLFLFFYVDLPLFHFKCIFPVYFRMILKGPIKIPSEVPHKFSS